MKKLFLLRFPLSGFPLAKTLRLNKPWKSSSKICHSESMLSCTSHHSRIQIYVHKWKMFSKICRSESTLSCRSRHSRIKIYAHKWKSFLKICRSESTLSCRFRHSRIPTQHEWCEELGRNPNWRVVMANYVCLYIFLLYSRLSLVGSVLNYYT